MTALKSFRKSFPGKVLRYLRYWGAALLMLCLVVSLTPSIATCAQITLGWTASSDPNVAGYKAYYGTSSRNYFLPGADAGKVTSFTFPGLPDGVPLYFAVTAYYASGVESGYSEEVVYHPPACTYSISPDNQSFSASGGPGTLGVLTQAGCAWTAAGNAAWLVVTSNSAGAGNATVYFSVSANPGPASRTGTMTVAGRTFTVNQSGSPCAYSISPGSQSFAAAGGAGAVSVTAPAGCSWNSSSNAGWLAVTSGASGSGNGSVAYAAAANTSSLPRSGALTVAGQTFAVSQQGVPCAYSLSPSGRSLSSGGGTGSIQVTAPGGCPWSAASGAGWITIVSGGAGTGNGTIGYSVSANPGSSTRTGSITAAGQAFAVSQAGVLQFSLSVSKTGTGTGAVSTNPPGTIFNQGTVVTLSAAPDGSSTFAGWSGACAGVTPNCAVTMNSDVSVGAAYRLKTFTITAAAGANGSISPGAAVTVDYGGSQLFNVTAASGYQVSDVQADGVSVGPVTSYLFGNVMGDHVLAASFEAVPAPPPAPFILGFSAGEVEIVGSGGVRYLPDRYSSGGLTRTSDAAIKKTADVALYQRERCGAFSYAIPLANGSYEVTLKFAELSWTSKGKRVFDVKVKGKPVLRKLDLYAVAGSNTAYDVSILVRVEDGVLNLDFIPVVDQPTVSAILIRALPESGSAPSSPAPVKRYFSNQHR